MCPLDRFCSMVGNYKELFFVSFSSKNTFVIAFAGGGIMNVTASLLMGIYVIFELMVSL